jgi:hypothetical protein
MIERGLKVYLYPHCDIAKEILLPFQVEGSRNKQKSEGKARRRDGQDKPPKILDSETHASSSFCFSRIIVV